MIFNPGSTEVFIAMTTTTEFNSCEYRSPLGLLQKLTVRFSFTFIVDELLYVHSLYGCYTQLQRWYKNRV